MPLMIFIYLLSFFRLYLLNPTGEGNFLQKWEVITLNNILILRSEIGNGKLFAANMLITDPFNFNKS